jgi:predicted amidohydrolase
LSLAIALVQFAVAPSQPLVNLARMAEFIEKAARQGAQLVVFPEDAVTGPLSGQTAFVPYAPQYLATFQQLAVRHQVDLMPGSWTVGDGAALYNTAHYISKDGSLAGVYHKINLWETEKAQIMPGAGVSVFPTAHGRVGMVICWDLSFPALFAQIKSQGAALVIVPAYWSFSRPAASAHQVVDDEIALIDALCTARAVDHQIALAYCNAAGELQSEGLDAVLSGRSQITHPQQHVVAKANGNAEQIVFAELALA